MSFICFSQLFLIYLQKTNLILWHIKIRQPLSITENGGKKEKKKITK